MASTTPPGPISIAILDDWANIASKHFETIPGLNVSSYPSTLSPAHPSELERLISRLQPYPIISTMRERTALPSALLSALPSLRLILTTGTRNASIDLGRCKAQGIPVAGTSGSVPAYFDSAGVPLRPLSSSASAASAASATSHPSSSAPRPRTPPGTASRTTPVPPTHGSTTQHALSLLLALTNRIAHDDHRLKTDGTAWQSGLSLPLGGRRIGIVGLGKLGAQMARACGLGLGMEVVAWSASLTQAHADRVALELGMTVGAITAVSKRELFGSCDVVSVHYVLSGRSRHLVGPAELQAMKSSAVLVNTARGPLVDEDALFEVLSRGGIAGAALDVFWEREPLENDSRWRTTRWGEEGRGRVVLSPHMGYVNESTMEGWYAEQAGDVERWMRGEELGVRLV